MELTDRQKYFLIIIAVFVLSFTIAALLGSVILTGNEYLPVSHDLKTLPFISVIRYMTDCLASSVIQLAFLFVSAYSSLTITVTALVFAYRGISLGYAVCLFSSGCLKFNSSKAYFLSAWKLSAGTFVFVLYFLSTVICIYLAYLAYDRAGQKNTNALPCMRFDCRYLLCFLVGSGAVFLCDIIKILLICNTL